jgi:hypothetical protein
MFMWIIDICGLLSSKDNIKFIKIKFLNHEIIKNKLFYNFEIDFILQIRKNMINNFYA